MARVLRAATVVIALVTGSLVLTAAPAAAADQMCCNAALYANQELVSTNGLYHLVMDPNGNLVLYAPGGLVIWQTYTYNNPNARLVMDPNGNLVLYSASWAVLWQTYTYGNNSARLVVQPDGNLVVYATNNNVLWLSNTSVPQAVQHRVLDANISGNVLNGGAFGVTASVESNSDSRSANVVILQEVCQEQSNDLVTRLGWSGYHFVTVPGFISTTCHNYGVTVFTASPVLRWSPTSLPSGGLEPRVLGCVDTRYARSCSTHFTNTTESLQDQQMSTVAGVLNPAATSGVAIIIGADMYEYPFELTPLYQFYMAGADTQFTFRNNNGCGLAPRIAEYPTKCLGPLQSKFDHILFSDDRIPGASGAGSVFGSLYSDHWWVFAYASVYW